VWTHVEGLTRAKIIANYIAPTISSGTNLGQPKRLLTLSNQLEMSEAARIVADKGYDDLQYALTRMPHCVL
jgi:hypothetical protein